MTAWSNCTTARALTLTAPGAGRGQTALSLLRRQRIDRPTGRERGSPKDHVCVEGLRSAEGGTQNGSREENFAEKHHDSGLDKVVWEAGSWEELV